MSAWCGGVLRGFGFVEGTFDGPSILFHKAMILGE